MTTEQGLPSLPAPPRDRLAAGVIAFTSAAILLLLFWLIYVYRGVGNPPAWTGVLPGLNACFNAVSTACIAAAVVAIRRRRVALHVGFIIAALVASGLFLAGYITNYTFHGDTRFPGTGWIRPVYFTVLISHIVLSVALVPLVLTTLFLAASRRFSRHRGLAHWTAPVWLYVSVTGVVIFLFLHFSGAYGSRI